jgi:hypothetical protein
VLVGATFTATRASRDRVEDTGTPAAQQQSAAPASPDSKPKRTEEVAAKPGSQKSESSSSSRQREERAGRARSERRPLSKPAAVARAIGQRRVVVLAFFQPGADDRATREAVASLRGRRAAVFTDKIDNLGRYAPVVGALGVHQAPAVVIVDSKRRARVIEGYIDPKSLAQDVADARG